MNTLILLEFITARQSRIVSLSDRLNRVASLHSLAIPFTIVEYTGNTRSILLGLTISMILGVTVHRIVESKRATLDSADPRLGALLIWFISIVNFLIATAIERLFPRFSNYII